MHYFTASLYAVLIMIISLFTTLISGIVYETATGLVTTNTWVMVSFMGNIFIVMIIGMGVALKNLKEWQEIDLNAAKENYNRLFKDYYNQGEIRMHDLVIKPKGYPYPGEVVSVFVTKAGNTRYVIESTSKDTEGMLHIFNADNLQVTKRAGYNLDQLI